MQDKKSGDEHELGLLRLVPEDLHRTVCTERPEQTPKKHPSLLRPPPALHRFSLVMSEYEKRPYIHAEVGEQDHPEIFHIHKPMAEGWGKGKDF